MKNILKRYKMFIALLCLNVALGIAFPHIGKSSLEITKGNIMEMLSVIPPIFILLGLLDVWVDQQTMMKYLGKGSGLKGLAIAFVLGSCASGPLYVAFPVAATMLKKRAGLFNVFVFVGAWSTTKIPMLTFEGSSMGIKFMLVRLCLSIIGIITIAFVVEKFLTEEDEIELYNKE